MYLILLHLVADFGFEDPSSKKWHEQLPQRLDQLSLTTSRSVIYHSSIETTRKSLCHQPLASTEGRRVERFAWSLPALVDNQTYGTHTMPTVWHQISVIGVLTSLYDRASPSTVKKVYCLRRPLGLCGRCANVTMQSCTSS